MFVRLTLAIVLPILALMFSPLWSLDQLQLMRRGVRAHPPDARSFLTTELTLESTG